MVKIVNCVFFIIKNALKCQKIISLEELALPLKKKSFFFNVKGKKKKKKD